MYQEERMGHCQLLCPPPTPTPAGHRAAAADRARIAVVGGSLTGPAAVLLLLAAGFEQVALYEAVPTGAVQGGGLISLEHSVLDVLDRLGLDQREFVACDSQSIVQINVRDRQIGPMVRRAYPGRFTTWTLLHQALLCRIPPGIVHRGRRVTGLVGEPAHHPKLLFADGGEETADLIIFADGRSSIGRRILDGQRRTHYAGYVAHRGQTRLPAGLATDLVDFLRFEPETGTQFNIAPIGAGNVDWIFYLNATASEYSHLFGAPPWRRTLATPAHISAAARDHVDEHASRLLPAELAALVTSTHTRMAVPIADIDPPTTMAFPLGAGHAVLLGDALAPVRAHTGRGANNGIEQAAGLVAVLTQHRKYHADLPGALHGWQRRHLPTAIAAVRQGPTIGARLGLGT